LRSKLHGAESMPGLTVETPAFVEMPAHSPARREKTTPVAVIRVPRMWPTAPRVSSGPAVQPISDTDGLSAFGSEREASVVALPRPLSEASVALHSPLVAAPAGESPSGSPSGAPAAIRIGFLFILLASVTAAGTWQYYRRLQTSAAGTLSIQTTPQGLNVVIDGSQVGATPLTVSLPPGEHRVQVGAEGSRRELDVKMVSGATIQHHLEIASPGPLAAAPATAGSLRVLTDGAPMAVTVDGVERGTSPLTINDLTPGEHQILVRADQRVVRKTVSVKAGETMSLVISPIASNVVAPGWLEVSSPVVMQLREGGQLIGTTEAQKLMLPAGQHDIEIVNDAIGFRASRKVTVDAGKVTLEAVEVPNGYLSVNAQPWAEVWVDGERVGETPIANLVARPGSHEVLFRHPQLGERRETILVTLRQPARLGVDLRK
jgi:PEGA domain